METEYRCVITGTTQPQVLESVTWSVYWRIDEYDVVEFSTVPFEDHQAEMEHFI